MNPTAINAIIITPKERKEKPKGGVPLPLVIALGMAAIIEKIKNPYNTTMMTGQ
jgi:hypothetical protein